MRNSVSWSQSALFTDKPRDEPAVSTGLPQRRPGFCALLRAWFATRTSPRWQEDGTAFRVHTVPHKLTDVLQGETSCSQLPGHQQRHQVNEPVQAYASTGTHLVIDNCHPVLSNSRVTSGWRILGVGFG
jgi:hypothetical protein